MIPYLFIRIPIRRILWQIEHVEPRLALNVAHRFLGNMWRRLIHYHHQMTLWMMPQHLSQEIDDLGRSDAFIVQAKNQLSATGDRRHGRHTTTLARHSLLRRLTPRCPCLAQKSRQRHVSLVLKVQNCLVFSDGLSNPWQLALPPLQSFLIRHFEVLTGGFLIAHSCLVQTTHHGLLRYGYPQLAVYDLDQSGRCPEIGLEPKLRSWREYYRCQCLGIQPSKFSRAARRWPAQQPSFTLPLEAHQPAVDSRAIRAIGLSNFRDSQPLCSYRIHGTDARLIRRITRHQKRSIAHGEKLSQLRAFVSIRIVAL